MSDADTRMVRKIIFLVAGVTMALISFSFVYDRTQDLTTAWLTLAVVLAFWIGVYAFKVKVKVP